MKKYRKAIIISFSTISLLSIGIIIFFYLKKLFSLPNISEVNSIVLPLIILILVFVLLLIASIVFFEIFQVKDFYKIAYFSRSIATIANTSKFLIVAKKKIRRIAKGKSAFIVSVGLENFQELQLSTLTTDEVSELLTIISNYLQANYIIDNFDSFCSYDEDGSFNLYLEKENQQEMINEVSNLIIEIKNMVKDKSYAPSIDLHAGACEIHHQDEVEEATHNASIARFYNMKNSSINIIMYDPAMRKETREIMKMKGDIERALQNHEFEVYYQPKYNIKLNRFIGAEALIRWHHPEKGFITPGAFIPFAEQTGQIAEIDRFVLDQVCKDIVSWKENKTRLLMISVNLSRNEILKSDVVEMYKSTLEKYHVSPLLIEIEITESAATKDILYTCRILEQLKHLRFRTSMDDFGTGYSSLSYLKKMPVDTLKLDKSFFDEIEIDKRSRDIVSTTIKLAKALEMSVIAEGIETEKQIQFLKTTDCDCIQGYYYARPLSKSEYESFLRNNKFEKKGM